MTAPKTRRAAVLAIMVGFLKAYRDVILDALGAGLVVVGVSIWSVPVALILAGIAVLLVVHPIPTRGRS